MSRIYNCHLIETVFIKDYSRLRSVNVLFPAHTHFNRLV